MNLLKFSYILAVLSGLHCYSAHAQMPQSSQFWLNSPLNTPAAMAGSNYAQVSTHYRRQAVSEEMGSQSFVLNGTLPLFFGKANRMGTAGISLLHDRSGEHGLLVTNGVLASYTYEVRLSHQHVLIGGLQAAYSSRGINWSKVSTDSQWQNGVYNPGTGTGESWSDERSGAFQANAGLGYRFADKMGQERFQLSAGAYNINRSSYQYLESALSEPLPLRLVAFASGVAVKNEFLELIPMLRWELEAGTTDITAGALLRRPLKQGVSSEEKHVGLGLFYSAEKTTVLALQFAQPAYFLAFSYDLSFGAQVKGTSNAVEVSLAWRMNRSSKGTNSFRELY